MHNSPSTNTDSRQYIQTIIRDKVIVFQNETNIPILLTNGHKLVWFCDFRLAFSDREFLLHAAKLFWERFDIEQPYQIGGLESASLPLITALVMQSKRASGFFIRKSRKKKGQTRLIEGDVNDNEVILVDDLINTGAAFEKQVAALEAEGKKVKAIFVLLHFYDLNTYTYFQEKGIPIYSLFDINEFEFGAFDRKKFESAFNLAWYFGAKNPHHLVQGARCLPATTPDHIFTASDNGMLWKIDSADGTVVTKSKLIRQPHPAESTFTNIVTGEYHVLVGTYAGELITCTRSDLEIVYRTIVADEFTSDITIIGDAAYVATATHSNSKVYSLLCFDLTKQRVAWQTPVTGEIVHITTAPGNDLLVCGTKMGHTYRIDPHTGAIQWEKRHMEAFIAAGTPLDPAAKQLMMMYSNGTAMILDTDTGRTTQSWEWENAVTGKLVAEDDFIYYATLEREVHCFNHRTGANIWTRVLDGRSYASPTIRGDYIYIGDNTGTLHKINKTSGERVDHYVVPERINNPVIVHEDNLIITTSANEIYMLRETIKNDEAAN